MRLALKKNGMSVFSGKLSLFLALKSELSQQVVFRS